MDQIKFQNTITLGKAAHQPQGQQGGPELWVHVTIFHVKVVRS